MVRYNRIPLTILTGFLGAGKTTLLNYLLQADHGLKVAVMVNDFGAVNIDSQLIVSVESDQTVNLANGCICCSIRDDLFEAAKALVTREHPPEYLVIEASGVSNPAQIAVTFIATALADRVRVDSILTVVDAEQFVHLSAEHESLAREQVAVADITVLNKVDLVTPAELDAVRARVRAIAPQSRILETTHAAVPLELVLGVGNFDPVRLAARPERVVHVHPASMPGGSADHAHGAGDDGHHHDDHTLVFDSWSYRDDRPLAYAALRAFVNALPVSIYRAKGIVHLSESPVRRGVLQVVGKRVRLVLGDPWGQEQPHTELVFIASAGGLDVANLQRQLEACRSGQRGGLAKVTGLVEWVRSAWELSALKE